MPNVSIDHAWPSGALVLSTTVTDGYATWLHTEQFMGYSERHARLIFVNDIVRKGWSFA